MEVYRWYGCGPFENYVDRKSAAHIGIYQKGLDEFYLSYVKPQESSNRTDTRWFEISTRRHPHRLHQAPGNVVNIDMKQRGVAGDIGWASGSMANPPYRIRPGAYEYGFRLMPIAADFRGG